MSAVVLTVVILIFGEVSPKSLAKENPETWAMFATPLLKLFMLVLTPLNFLFTQWKKLLSLVFRNDGGDGITEEELVGMVDQAENEGGLDQHESNLIRNAIEFNDLEVSEILTPRVDLVAIEDDYSMEQVAALFVESGYSRLPIFHDNIDNIVGVVHEKDFYAARYRGETDINKLKSPVLYTTGNTKISELLRILQKNKAHMAIVVDEYGGTEGIATLEDIVEELVGEIWDEHDEVIELIHKQEDDSYLISCSAALDDLYDLFSIKGECDAATISGWVLEQVGRVPEVGDHFEAEGLDVTDEIAEQIGLSNGFFLTGALDNSPAYTAGMQSGDVIVAIDEEMVTSVRTLRTILNSYEAGESAEITVMREGKDTYREIQFNIIFSER